ncbi:MAG: hypothetical protein ABR608_00920 [Pseudonocardiaceae bacterium]
MLTQIQELVRRIHGALTEPWNKKTGRPKSCELYRAVEIACMYVRQNATQEFLGAAGPLLQATLIVGVHVRSLGVKQPAGLARRQPGGGSCHLAFTSGRCLAHGGG